MRQTGLGSWLACAAITVGVGGAALSACAGKTTSTPTDGADASTSPEAGPGANAPGCPATEPAQDSACTKDGLLCEYGADFDPLCNSVIVCSGTRWARPITYGGAQKCPSQLPTIPPNPADCPASRASVPPGACSSASTCQYDGATCTCGVHCSNYPIRQPDCAPDAGVKVGCCDTSKVEWACFEGPLYCATPRPRVGAPCTKEGEACAVSPPSECGQTTLACRGGVWSLPNATCAASSRGVKKEIAYVDDAQREALRAQLLAVRLASYRYKVGDDATHLGFIIEDMPEGSPAVLASRDRVDVYGYTSMVVAALQEQQKQLDALSLEVKRLAAENAALRKGAKAR